MKEILSHRGKREYMFSFFFRPISFESKAIRGNVYAV